MSTIPDLVGLANVGASGLCVAAVFYLTHLLRSLPNDATKRKHDTVRFYIVTVFLMAVVLAGSSILGEGRLKELQRKNSDLMQAGVERDAKIAKLEAESDEEAANLSRYRVALATITTQLETKLAVARTEQKQLGVAMPNTFAVTDLLQRDIEAYKQQGLLGP